MVTVVLDTALSESGGDDRVRVRLELATAGVVLGVERDGNLALEAVAAVFGSGIDGICWGGADAGVFEVDDWAAVDFAVPGCMRGWVLNEESRQHR